MPAWIDTGERQCVTCKTRFKRRKNESVAQFRRRSTHSKECSKKYRSTVFLKKVEEKYCSVCDKIIPRYNMSGYRYTPSQYRKRKVCSVKCNSIFKAKHYIKERRYCKYKECGVLLTRKVYKKTIEQLKSLEKRKYCSQRCANTDKRRKVNYRRVYCAYCENVMPKKSTPLLDNRRKFCDKMCKNMFIKEYGIGRRFPEYFKRVQKKKKAENEAY